MLYHIVCIVFGGRRAYPFTLLPAIVKSLFTLHPCQCNQGYIRHTALDQMGGKDEILSSKTWKKKKMSTLILCFYTLVEVLGRDTAQEKERCKRQA